MGNPESLEIHKYRPSWNIEGKGAFLQSSGKAMSLHPAAPASLMYLMVFWVESSRLNHPGSALTAAALYFLIVAGMIGMLDLIEVLKGVRDGK